ncbi:TlpA disulfide reductase family protein [Aquabacterium humicola]|uniref:TlpA disulfide reductase family protein n=1 Tax=Aquabacterium humicola TaxID=3237377 RepID=UPI0025432ED1|nr:TlpA disulfide reductase family protein [Rubrivivax pictus]
MTNAVQIGPLLLPLQLILVLASVGLAFATGLWLGKRASVKVEDELWLAVLVCVLAARLAFVYEYRGLYLASPLTILDLRDGGWNAPAGLAGGWLLAFSRWRKRPGLVVPLRAAMAAGTALFVAGTAALVLHPVDRALPDLSFKSLDGTDVRLDSFSGKPVVINLWATWCPPCVREMPVLQQGQRDRRDVTFVFLNQGEDPGHVKAWLQRQGLDLENALTDPLRQASAAFKQQGYPTTLFFDRHGKQVASHIGALSTATLAQRLERITGPH